MHLNIEKGIVSAAKIYGDFFAKRDISDFENILIGVRHDEKSVTELLSNINTEDYFLGVTNDDIMSLMF